MAWKPATEANPKFAPLVETATRSGCDDADDVAKLLSLLGLRSNLDRPILLAPSLLIGLAAAMRMLRWESQGFHPHRVAGLPAAIEVIKTVFGLVRNAAPAVRDTEIARLYATVNGLSLHRFAWEGQATYGADVFLEHIDEELLLDAFAEVIWQMQHRSS